MELPMKKSFIEIRELVLMCHLGVPRTERDHRQKVFVSLNIYADYSASEESDKITDTIDYSDIITAICELVVAERFLLIEHLASRIKKLTKSMCHAETIDVTVRKPNVIQQAAYVAYHHVE
jgi:dihydroneopterin aldolase